MTVKVGNKYIDETSAGIVEVGGDTSFIPKFKFKKWLELSSLSLHLDVDESGTEAFEEGKVKWKGQDKKELHCYPVSPTTELPDGGHEVEVIIKKKNGFVGYIEFTIENQNASMVLQTPMSERVGIDGIAYGTDTIGYDSQDNPIHQQSELNVNSIAIFHPNTPLNMAGGQVYGNGKIGHFLRAKAHNKYDDSTWCLSEIIGNKLRITIPPAFWADSDVYPIRIDPTFGYAVIGGSNFVPLVFPVCHVGAGLIHTAANHRITLFSVYGNGTGCDAAVYNIAGGVPVNRLGVATNVNMGGGAGWKNSAAVSIVMMNGVVYGMAVGAGNGNNMTLYYDLGAGNQRSAELNPGALPAAWTHASYSNVLYSFYATYESFIEDLV